MFKFSSNTQYDKVFKLNDIYKKIGASKEVKQDASVIKGLTLKYVLTPKTLNCSEDVQIKEVFVFELELSSKQIPIKFIKEFDSDIKMQTVFICKYEGLECGYTAFKSGSNRGKYFETAWTMDKEYEIPVGVNVPEIYKYILSKFLKYEPFEAESVEEYIKRYNLIIRLDFQINSTTIAIGKESQSKKKFEYNARLKEYKKEKEQLLREKLNG